MLTCEPCFICLQGSVQCINNPNLRVYRSYGFCHRHIRLWFLPPMRKINTFKIKAWMIRYKTNQIHHYVLGHVCRSFSRITRKIKNKFLLKFLELLELVQGTTDTISVVIRITTCIQELLKRLHCETGTMFTSVISRNVLIQN